MLTKEDKDQKSSSSKALEGTCEVDFGKQVMEREFTIVKDEAKERAIKCKDKDEDKRKKERDGEKKEKREKMVKEEVPKEETWINSGGISGEDPTVLKQKYTQWTILYSVHQVTPTKTHTAKTRTLGRSQP